MVRVWEVRQQKVRPRFRAQVSSGDVDVDDEKPQVEYRSRASEIPACNIQQMNDRLVPKTSQLDLFQVLLRKDAPS